MTPKELHDELKRLLALTHDENMPMRIRGDASVSLGEVAGENINAILSALLNAEAVEGARVALKNALKFIESEMSYTQPAYDMGEEPANKFTHDAVPYCMEIQSALTQLETGDTK